MCQNKHGAAGSQGREMRKEEAGVGVGPRLAGRACGALALFVSIGIAHAQQPPAAGDALRDIQDKARIVVPPTPDPRIDVAPEKRPAIKPVPGFTVDVKAFRFTGLTATRPERLQPLVQRFTGPGKTFDDLQAATEAVSEYLQQQGFFVAQAFLPEQKIEDGVVEITVLEGRLAEVKIDREPGLAVSRPIIEGLLSPLRPGTVMHRDTVERALFLVSDLRGVLVRSIVEPGAQPGTANLVLRIAPGRRVDAVVELDNYGSRFTGEYRAGAGVNINSPFLRGDLFSVRVLKAIPEGGADIWFGRVSYLSPVGNHGTKLDLAYTRLNYHLGTAQFEPLDQMGRAEVASVIGLHPVVRTRNFNLFGQGAFDLREFRDDIRAAATISERNTMVGMVGLVGDSRDTLLGGGVNNFSLAVTRGDLDIKTPAFLAADQAPTGRRTQGGYTRFNGSVGRLNAIAESTVLYTVYSFQLASKNLDASEKMSLGGPHAVRAYALGEGTADEAHLFTTELRYGLPRMERVPGNIVLSAFFDAAHGRLDRKPVPAPFPSPNTRTLSGVGVGATWGRAGDFSIRGSLAWRTSGAPVSDPRDRSPRLYLQLQKYY